MFVQLVLNGEDARELAVRRLLRVPFEPLHEVRIKLWRPPKTSRQNKTLWMWHREVAAHILARTGTRVMPETIHEHLFLPRFMPVKETVTVGGESITIPMGTSDMDNDRPTMKEAMDAYEAWCTTNEIEITIPEEREP